MPRACTVSPSRRSDSENASDWAEAIWLSAIGLRDWISFSQVRTTRMIPPAKASVPSIQWNEKITARKIGVQGMSKIEKGAGLDSTR